MNGRKLLHHWRAWVATIKGRRCARPADTPEQTLANLKAAFRAGAEAVEREWWTNEIAMLELRHAVIEHCGALRQTIALMEAGKYKGAMARLEGAVADLERACAKGMRDKKIELRARERREAKKRKP